MKSFNIKRFNRSKWDKDVNFYLSELQKGHIDLISPWDRSFCDYWNIDEVYNSLTSISISNHYGLKLFETDDNFVVGDLFQSDVPFVRYAFSEMYHFFLLTDWIQYWKLKNSVVSKEDIQIKEFQRMLNLKRLGV